MVDKTRIFATMIIWSALTFILSILSWRVFVLGDALSGPEAIFTFVLMVTVALAATLSTRAIWHHAQIYQADQPRAASHERKAKRTEHDRVKRLIEDLDDDDIYDLEALRLARESDRGSDGEISARQRN